MKNTVYWKVLYEKKTRETKKKSSWLASWEVGCVDILLMMLWNEERWND